MITCGTDIIKVSRVKDSIDKIGNTFINRIYTEEEISYCESRRMCKYQSYAARFAAKEAIYKAFAPSINDDISWKDAEVCKASNGKPYIKLYGKLKEEFEKGAMKSVELSLSHDDDYAIAYVILDRGKE